MSGEGVKCRAYRYVKACERRRRIGRHLCKTCVFNENANHKYLGEKPEEDVGKRYGFREKCAGCKHEISCWTAYDGLYCYEPKDES